MKNTSGVYSTTTAKIDVAISAYWAHAVFDRVETNERENSRSRRPSAVEREAQKPFKQPKSEKVLSEYEQDQNASRENLQRLRTERLSRESMTGHAAGKRANRPDCPFGA